MRVARRTRGYPDGVVRCRLLGHRYRFDAEGDTMVWWCARGCPDAGGRKRYATAQQARRYAAAFDREDRDDVGRRAPLLGMLPLRIWRGLRDRAMR